MGYASWSVVFGEQPSAAKWNILGTNDASFNDGTGIADSKILPKHLLTGTGSTNWVWQSWTPSLTNLAGGISNYAKYIQIGKTVIARWKYTFAGADISGGVLVSLPVTSNADYASSLFEPLGQASLRDTSATTTWPGWVMWNSSTTFTIRRQDATPNMLVLSSTTPFTWAVNDIIEVLFMYEAA